jgi:Yip1 domain
VASFFYRIAGAATLDPRTFEDVEADQTATGQALAVVLIASLAAGVGASGWNPGVGTVAIRAAAAAVLALLAWIAWALVTFEIGSRLLAEPQTRTDVGELLRTLGFSAAPGLFLVFGVFPGFTTPVFAITSVWLLAAMVLALKQALDYRSAMRALAVCAIGWLLALVFILFFGVLAGPSLTAQTKPPASAFAAGRRRLRWRATVQESLRHVSRDGGPRRRPSRVIDAQAAGRPDEVRTQERR